MNDEIVEECMKMTSFGGQAKSLAIAAIARAREGQFADAAKLMDEAEGFLHRSHDAHVNLLGASAADENGGAGVTVTVFLVHAADHLSSADTVFLLAKELILLYQDRREEL